MSMRDRVLAAAAYAGAATPNQSQPVAAAGSLHARSRLLDHPKPHATGGVIYQLREVGQDIFDISSGVVALQSTLAHLGDRNWRLTFDFCYGQAYLLDYEG